MIDFLIKIKNVNKRSKLNKVEMVKEYNYDFFI
jgi:hypothetical protein